MLRWKIWVMVGIAVSVGSLGTPRIAQAFLGASAADLVYTPVTPCRIIDTRAMGAGGPITPGMPRDFLVSGTTDFEGQGGTAGGCGIPKGATAAMLNLVAVNPSGPGDLRVWPFGQPEPFASILNYGLPGSGLNLANGVVLPLCDQAFTMCTFDVSVAADVNGAQLVVDVLGFLQSIAPRGDAGLGNTFLGVNAGNFTTFGTANTATGVAALQRNTLGSENTATGLSALNGNTSGSNNTAMGALALQANGTGDGNTAMGRLALFSNTTGFGNTATGAGALNSNTTGSLNTAVGTGANVSAFNLTNATAIGAGAVVDASNKIRLGDASVTLVETAGNLRVGAGTTTGCVQDGDGTVLAGTCVSDARLKTGLRRFAPLLARLVQLQPVHFQWHAEEYPELQLGEALSVGLVAQEVEQVLPELVTEDARGYKAVRYHLLPLMLIQALKEQQAVIERQQQDIEELKGALLSRATREAMVQGLEQRTPENAELRSARSPSSGW